MRVRSKELALGMGTASVTIGVRGPGQVVGAVSMGGAPRSFECSARARGQVLALKMLEDDFLNTLAQGVVEEDLALSRSENVIPI